MQPAPQTDDFLKAICSFLGRFMVVAPDFRILAISCRPNAPLEQDFVGRRCHDAVCDRREPGPDCAVKAVLATRKPA
jgi:hypothetical protein